jgi:hypothetical protein
MKTILPLLFLGVVAGSCLVGAAANLPVFKVERWVNSAPLTAAGLRGKVVLVDVWDLHQLDSYLALCRGVESRVRPARAGRDRSALAGVRVR